MSRITMALAAALSLVGAGPACVSVHAATESSFVGVWNREDGLGGVRIAICGGALCGDIAWLRDPRGPGHVGQRVLFDMRQTAADTWSGTALNPEDGRQYSGSMTIAGRRLITQGCAFGGLICKTVALSRDR